MTTRSEWVQAFPLDEVPVGEARVWSRERRRIAVFRTAPDQAYALDDRCPHEGYPLVRGHVKDCVVTCIWHNFKFDLRDGRCVMGDEHARSYPLRIVGGKIELDLAEPDPALELARLHASLERGLDERKLGQLARDIVRMLQLGADPADIAAAAARFDAVRADYGTTHALPVAHDTLAMIDRYPGVEGALPLLQAFDLASESHQRRPPRPTPAPVDPGDDPAAAGERLRALVEAEDTAAAEALLRGALELRRWGRAVIEPWLYRLCCDHFLDFGHALIYQVKLFDFLAKVGWSHAPALLPAHLVRIVSGTREEQVPAWKWMRGQLAEHAPRFPEWYAKNLDRPRDPAAGAALRDALIAGEREDIVDALVAALASGAGLDNLADALVVAAAERLLRFDAAIDADPTVQEGWLDVTHRLTFASALRTGLARHRDPEVLRLLFQAAQFIDLAQPLDRPDAARPPPAAGAPEDPEDAAQAVLSAVQQRDREAALALAAAYLAGGHPIAPLQHALTDATLRDPAARPIFVAHAIKTCVTAFAERAALADHPDRDVPVLAFVRYFAGTQQERALVRLVHEAIGFVVHGKVPRTLT